MRRITDLCLAGFTVVEGYFILYLIETFLPTKGYEMGHIILWFAAVIVTVSSFTVTVVHQWTKDKNRRRKALIKTIIIAAVLHCLIWLPVIGESEY